MGHDDAAHAAGEEPGDRRGGAARDPGDRHDVVTLRGDAGSLDALEVEGAVLAIQIDETEMERCEHPEDRRRREWTVASADVPASAAARLPVFGPSTAVLLLLIDAVAI